MGVWHPGGLFCTVGASLEGVKRKGCEEKRVGSRFLIETCELTIETNPDPLYVHFQSFCHIWWQQGIIKGAANVKGLDGLGRQDLAHNKENGPQQVLTRQW
jgi:hypothetical protein